MAAQSGIRNCGLSFLGASDTDWNLMGSTGNRTWAKLITFPTQFSTLPSVTVSIAGFHIIEGESARLSVGVGLVETTGFWVQIQTWGDTQVAGVAVQWLAYDNLL